MLGFVIGKGQVGDRCAASRIFFSGYFSHSTEKYVVWPIVKPSQQLILSMVVDRASIFLVGVSIRDWETSSN